MAKAQKNAAVVTKAVKGFVNPYRANGSYWTVCEVLARLGMNHYHAADLLVKDFPKVMGSEKFTEFKSKEARNENGKNCEGRIIQNANVVMRPDYGKALRDTGHEVRKQKTAKGWEFGLFKGIEATAAPKAPKAAAKPQGKQKATTAPKSKAKAAKAPKAAKAK
jgi:hypothetical protein